MMDLIQRYFSKKNYNRSEVRKNFSHYFFSLPEHKWLCQGHEKDHFEKLINLLPTNLLETMMSKFPISFITSENMGQFSPGTVFNSTVVIFPEFQKLLKTNKKCAVAYLAHELALVLYELEEAKKENLMAEIEADKFVSDLGLTFELEEFLLMLDETIEKRMRLTYLTINHFNGNNN